MHRARCGGKVQSSHALSRHDTLLASHMLTNPETLNSVLLSFYTPHYICMLDWPSHHDWLLVIHSTSSPSPPLLPAGEEGAGRRVQCSSHMVPRATSPHPGVLSKSHLVNLKKDNFISLIHLLENPKSSRGSVPEMRTKTKYILLSVNHNSTIIKAESSRFTASQYPCSFLHSMLARLRSALILHTSYCTNTSKRSALILHTSNEATVANAPVIWVYRDLPVGSQDSTLSQKTA